MSNNKFRKNILINFNPNNVFAIMPSKSSSELFFRIPFILNKELSINLVKKVQVICQNKESFSRTFKNNLFSESSNLKHYSDGTNNYDYLKDSILKNIYYDYNEKTKNLDENLVYESDFNQRNFKNNSENQYANLDLFNLDLSVNFSKKLKNKKVDSIRIFLLGEKNVILDQTDILECNFSKISRDKVVIDQKIFYRRYFLDNFIDNISLSISKDCTELKINSTDAIDFNFFENIELTVSYFKSISGITVACETKDLERTNKYFVITNNVIDFARIISESFYEENLDNFNIQISVKLNIKDNSDNEKVDSKTKNIKYSTSLSFKRNSKFIKDCVANNKIIYSNSIINALSLKQDLQLVEGSIIANNLISFSNSLKEDILKQIIIKDIKINNTSLDYFYKDSSLSINSIVTYKNKSLLDVASNSLNAGGISLFSKVSNREIVCTVFLEFLGNNFTNISNKLVSKEDYSSIINTANKILKNNIFISNITLNSNLNLNQRSIYLYDDIIISNVSEFSDIAYSLGYVENNQGDVKSFFESCIVKIENNTKINQIKMNCNKLNYFSFKEIFDLSTINEGSIAIKNSYINDFIHTDDFYHLTSKKSNIKNKDIVRFFISETNTSSFKSISKVPALNLENLLTIQILPFPEVVSRFRGYGIDSDRNVIIEENYNTNNAASSNFESISEARKILTREMMMFYYTGNPNLNWTKFLKYRDTFMDETKSKNTSNYSEIFEDLILLSVNKKNIFSEKSNYEKDELISLVSNLDQSILTSNIITSVVEESFKEKYYNLNLNNKETFYFEENFPYSLLFENEEYFANEDEYVVKEISFLKNSNINNKLKINLDHIEKIYNFEENIAGVDPYVRISFMFLMTNKEKLIDQSIVENTDFLVTNYKGNDYLTFNSNFIKNNKENFSNLSNTIENSFINVTKENNVFLNIDISKGKILDIDNVKYQSYATFFDFCKSNNIVYLEKVLIRTSLSFKILNTDDCIFSTFNFEVPVLNLNNKNIRLDRLNKMSTIIVS